MTTAAKSSRSPALDPEVVSLPHGSFLMGATDDDKFATDTERPAHEVSFRAPFALGRFAVTVGEFRTFLADYAPGVPDELPATRLSWHDASAYCVWLHGGTGRPFRLPTEAEWEYACRAGTATPFATGGDIAPDEANFLYSEAGERIGLGLPRAGGQYPANAFGLHDLHGNVCEWVQDGWHPTYIGAPTDGRAWLEGGDPARRVIRGGAWDHLPRLLRSPWRDAIPATSVRDNVGFRIALTLES